MKSEIKKFFKGEVEDDVDTLEKYSHDASLLEVMPKVVVFPVDAEDVKNLVKWVGENQQKYPGLSITPRCAGTDMSGGAIGESIIMDFTKHMNKLIGGPLPLEEEKVNNFSTLLHPTGGTFRHQNYPPVPSYITVQPGMFYRDFEKITLTKGLILPCYTASKSLNAVGGMYGNNSAGERTLKYGKTEDYIMSAKVVFSDGNEYLIEPLTESELKKKMGLGGAEGEIYRRIYKLINDNIEDIKHAKPNVHKNSAGYYIWNVMSDQKQENPLTLLQPSAGTFRQQNFPVFDLNKLLVGSQGTLGIVTEITFKIIPNIKHSKLVAIFMNDLTPLGRLVDEILELNPETLEAYDDKTMKLAVKFFPDFLKNKGFIGMLKFMRNFLPEFFMMLGSLFGGSGFPKLILLAEFAGADEKEVHEQCLKLEERIKHFKLKIHVTKNETEANKYWDIRRESFALLRKHVKGMRTAPFIDDIIVRPEFLPRFIPELNSILSKYKLTYTIAGHAGDGNFHIIPLMDFKRTDTAQIIIELSDKVYDLVLRYHGSITAEHNDGLIRTPYLQKMYGEKIIKIFTEIKNIFDSQNIFNPGKKIVVENGAGHAGGRAGTKEYISSHIAEEHIAHHRV